MADFASALHALLKADPDVSGAVGARIYPRNRPQNSPLPAIRYSLVSDIPHQDLGGASGSWAVRAQVDVFASTYGEARRIAKLIGPALEGPANVAGIKWGGSRYGAISDGQGEETPNGYVHMVSVDLLTGYSVA